MNKTLSNFILAFLIGAIFINCANRGTPSGGPKDEVPPVIMSSDPENYSTNFNGKEIEVTFDEYIKIKDLSKQLIISPPMKTQPEVTPLGSASKKITIKIYDVLGNDMTSFVPNKEHIEIVTLEKRHIEAYRNKLKFLNDKDSFNIT